MRVITISNQRGGIGKSTTAAALAQAACYKGLKCLVIDLDPQGHVSFFTGADTNAAGAFDLLEGQPAAEVIQETAAGLDVIPANWSLLTVTTGAGSARRLRKALEPIKEKYDLIIIDTPATAGELQNNALMASTDLIIPLQADVTGTKSLYLITDAAKQIQRANPDLQITGYLLTCSGERSTLARQMAEQIQQRAAAINVPCLGAIRKAVAIREAQAMQQSLFDYAPKSKPAEDYLALLEKLTGAATRKQGKARSKAGTNKKGV